MPEFQEAETITITIDNKDYKLFRDEILSDPELSEIFLMLDRVRKELHDLDYEYGKLQHAKISLQITLQQMSLKRVKAKFDLDKPIKEED
jgi:hypothetical protein